MRKAFLLTIALFAAHVGADSLTLSNDAWRLDVDPQTLAVTAQLKDGSQLEVASPQPAATISHVVHEPTEARWLRW